MFQVRPVYWCAGNLETETLMADEGVQSKLDRYNEMLLKNTALTFSSEGLSRDIKSFLARKAEFVSQLLMGTAAVMEASQKPTVRRRKALDDLLEHVIHEAKVVNMTTNYVLSSIMQKEITMARDAAEPDEKDDKKESPKQKVSKKK